jgi:hypothetical protein
MYVNDIKNGTTASDGWIEIFVFFFVEYEI